MKHSIFAGRILLFIFIFAVLVLFLKIRYPNNASINDVWIPISYLIAMVVGYIMSHFFPIR